MDTQTVVFGIQDHSNSHAKWVLAFGKDGNAKIDIWEKHMPNNVLVYFISKGGKKKKKMKAVYYKHIRAHET